MENSTTIRGILKLQTTREGTSEAQNSTKDPSTARSLTDDISTARSVTEDIQETQLPPEDIIIKCGLEQIIKNFFQDYVIVWHDPNIDSQENQHYIAQLKKFCDVFTFTEWQKAKDFIQSTSAACHVVTSGTNGELLVKEVNQLQSVTNFYIFCGNKEYHSNWAKNYSKVSCIETNIQSLLSQIQHNLLAWYKQASSLKLNLPAFAPIFNDTDKSQMNNLHRFLKVIPNFQNRLQAKNDFVNLSKAIYSDPKNTKLISEFEQNYNIYDKEQTLRWYSQESFLYKITNNCLRIATSDSIQYCRLLLQDIQKAIKEHYQTKSKNFNGLLYRGAYLSQEEWSSLKRNLNREIEIHGFLSVSKVKNIGLNFMKVDPSKKALITIIVPKGPNEEEQGFAEMEEFSEYPQEKEILFNVRSRFTILETEDEPYRHLVLLYGAQGFRKYMTEQNPVLEISIPSQKDILCSQCKVPRGDEIFFISLIDPQKQSYYCKECLDSNFSPFLCIPLFKKEPYTIKISGFLLKNSSPPDLPFYGYKCSSSECQAKKQKQYFICTDCDLNWCQNCFENSHSYTHNIILETSPFTFWSQKMSQHELSHLKFQSDLLTSKIQVSQQADMYSESQLYEKAIEYYNIYIQQNEAKGKDSNLAHTYNNLDNQSGIATIYSNIGNVYDHKEEYPKALEYYFQSLDILTSLSEDNQAEIFTCYNNLGLVSHHQGEYVKALEYYFKSLDIAKSVYGDSHPEVATSLHNIGGVYEEQKEYTKAFEYYLKSLDIFKLAYGENHPAIANSLTNIGLAFSNQAEYKKALEYYFESLDVIKSVYGDNHPDAALSFNNIGLAFFHQAEYEKALESYLKALDINKSVYKENHPEIATSFNNIGLVYEHQGEFQKALQCYFKSLDIYKLAYGENHPMTATSLSNIGLACFNQAEYDKALEYHFKSLDVYKAVYGDIHLDTATSYQNIGLVFREQGEYNKALEYFFKCLDISKSVYGENHPEISPFYQNIGLVYEHQGEYQKALEYYFKSLEIDRLVYGEKHSFVATSFNIIAAVYYKQEEYKKTLEYYFKSLDIYKAVHGDSHPDVATSYQNIGLVYSRQGEYKKALEYFMKCLEIQKSLYGENHSKTITTQKLISQIQSIE